MSGPYRKRTTGLGRGTYVPDASCGTRSMAVARSQAGRIDPTVAPNSDRLRNERLRDAFVRA